MKLRKRIEYYKTKDGKEPVKEWLHSLDISVRSRIDSRLTRVLTGNYGDINLIKGPDDVIRELKFHFGAGYRIYFYEDGVQLLLLLSSGDKKKQKNDINKARERLDDYKTRKFKGEL